MTITILGSGTSTGVPMIGCDCRTCQSRDPRDQRLRTSALIEHRGLNVVIDTSADFRAQMLEARLTHLEAVLYTHQHYDHIAGFDDLRAFQFLRRVAPTCYANVATYDHIRKAFDYAFGHATQHGGGLPQVPFEVIDEAAFTIEGPRGARLEVLPIPLLHEIPIIGAALFAQPMVTYLLYVMVPVLGWWLTRTGAGLALRAVGERPEAAVAAGISPVRVRWAALLFCGAMGGLSGGTLVLAQVGTFNEGISAGRGFIAIAIVVLGRWSALGVTGAALLFGAASALQYLAQAMGWGLPYQFSLALPYVLTLIALAGTRGRSAAPAALGVRG